MNKTLDIPEKIQSIRSDFPILSREVKGKPLVYLDNAASTQKPQVVIDAISHFFENTNANVHRGIHTLSEEGTLAMEGSRDKVAKFLNAKREEIVFTKGTTESINLVASSFGEIGFSEGDEILITTMEHHANIVPWQMLCERKGLKLKVAPISEKGEILLDDYKRLLSEKTKLVAAVHTSNSLGTVNPIEEMIAEAKKVGAKVLLDGAQAVAHQQIDVKALDVDFFVFSGHKLFGPTGIGILFGKESLLEAMPPYQGGGEMIAEVSFEKTTYNELPYKFEAGTPHISGAIVLGTAIDYVKSIGFEDIQQHEKTMLAKGTELLKQIDGLKIIGEAEQKVAILSFLVEGVHHQDLALFLDTHGIAVRTGHHCTQPLMHRFGVEGTTRASFAMYNTLDEVEFFAEKLERTINILR